MHRLSSRNVRYASRQDLLFQRQHSPKVEKLINRAGPGDATHSKLAPSPDFSVRSLRDIYDHFISLRENDESTQQFYFIVADRAKFTDEGVLYVCLDICNERNGEVGVARCPVDMADWRGAGLYYRFWECREMQEAANIEFSPREDPEKQYDTQSEATWLRTIYRCYSLVEKRESDTA